MLPRVDGMLTAHALPAPYVKLAKEQTLDYLPWGTGDSLGQTSKDTFAGREWNRAQGVQSGCCIPSTPRVILENYGKSGGENWAGFKPSRELSYGIKSRVRKSSWRRLQ